MTHHGSPSFARVGGQARAGPFGWPDLVAELDRWAAAARNATFWWRDDDAAAVTEPLLRLLELCRRHGVPLALAVIPQPADPALAALIARSDAPVTVMQHGFAHRNHAPEGAKSAELGDHRPPAAVAAELTAGRERLAALFGDRLHPAMVPPWNRIGDAVAAALPGLGFRGLSTFGARAVAGTGVVNTHIDIVDWHGGRGFAGDDACLAAAIRHLEDRRTGRCDPEEPTGLLTHHRDHDAACWRFVDRFLAATLGHRAAAWLTPSDAFARAGA